MCFCYKAVIRIFIDPDAVQADSFLTLMGLEIGGIADYFCRGGVHCCPMKSCSASYWLPGR